MTRLTTKQIVDRVWAGDSNPTWNPAARPPASDEEIDRIKRNIEVQLQEYAAEINAAAAWISERRKRRPRGFRAKRKA